MRKAETATYLTRLTRSVVVAGQTRLKRRLHFPGCTAAATAGFQQLQEKPGQYCMDSLINLKRQLKLRERVRGAAGEEHAPRLLIERQTASATARSAGRSSDRTLTTTSTCTSCGCIVCSTEQLVLPLNAHAVRLTGSLSKSPNINLSAMLRLKSSANGTIFKRPARPEREKKRKKDRNNDSLGKKFEPVLRRTNLHSLPNFAVQEAAGQHVTTCSVSAVLWTRCRLNKPDMTSSQQALQTRRGVLACRITCLVHERTVGPARNMCRSLHSPGLPPSGLTHPRDQAQCSPGRSYCEAP